MTGYNFVKVSGVKESLVSDAAGVRTLRQERQVQQDPHTGKTDITGPLARKDR